jgi:hypothetical protein
MLRAGARGQPGERLPGGPHSTTRARTRLEGPRGDARQATASGNEVKTSQLALPLEACNAAYATTGYSASVTNLATLTVGSPA